MVILGLFQVLQMILGKNSVLKLPFKEFVVVHSQKLMVVNQVKVAANVVL